MVRKAQEDTLTIGFFGSGEVSQESVEAHLDDFLSTQPEKVTFVVPVVKTMWTDTIQWIIEYAQEHDIPYVAVHDEVSGKARNLGKYLKAAAETDEGAKIGLKISNRIISAGKDNKDEALLGMAWADDDKELNDVCERIAKAGIPAREFAATAFEVVDFEVKEDDDEQAVEASKERHPTSNGTSQVVAEPAADDDGEWEPYTRAELEKVVADKTPQEALALLKAIALDYKIDVKPRTRMTTLVDMILSHQEVLAKVGATPGGPTPSKAYGIDVDYDQIAKIVREEIIALLEPEQVLDVAFGEIVSVLETISNNLDSLAEAVNDLQVGVPEMIEIGSDDDEITSENDPADEPEPVAPARRRRRI